MSDQHLIDEPDVAPDLWRMFRDRICDLFDLIAIGSAGLALIFLLQSISAAFDGVGMLGVGETAFCIALAVVPGMLAQGMHRLLNR